MLPRLAEQLSAAVRIAGGSASGEKLPACEQRLLEGLTGADLSGVRIHVSRDVPALGARAITCGDHVHFAPGSYDPASEASVALLGHEIAHVLQQRSAKAVVGRGVTLRLDALDELEAEMLGAAAEYCAGVDPAVAAPAADVRLSVRAMFQRAARSGQAGRTRTLQPSILPSGVFGGLDPNKRQNVPSGWTRTKMKPDIDWKYHHVISWDALRDTWQGLLEHQAWDTLEAYMHAVNVKGASGIRGKLHRGEDLDINEREEVYQKISWPAWNIVEGPADRADEGGNELDLFQHGMPQDHYLRHTQIDLLWKSMSAFLAKLDRPKLKEGREKNKNKHTGPQVNAKYDAGVNDASARLAIALSKMRAYQEASFIPYIPSMWQVVNPGYVDKNARAAWTTRPTFEKADATRSHIGALPAKMRCPGCLTTFDTPNAVIGTNYPCPSCDKFVYIEFKNAV